MNDLDTRRYEMLARVRDFGAAHADSFPTESLGGKMFAAIASAVKELDAHASLQASGKNAVREGSSSKAAARAALREELDAISRTARALAIDTPGLDDKFRMPRGQSDQALLHAARAFARDAVPLSQVFITHEMPAGFIDNLNEDIKDLEQAISSQATGIQSQVAATAALEAAMEKGLTALERLDAIIVNKLGDDTPAMAAWESARHVERAVSSKAAAAPASAASGSS